MRTPITVLVLVLCAALVTAGAAAAKDPGSFRVEVSGGNLAEPLTLPDPVSMETVFLNDSFSVAAPEGDVPAYQLRLISDGPSNEAGEDHVINLRYFPDAAGGQSLLSGSWDYDRYFLAGAEFDAMLSGAIDSALSGNVTSSPTAGDSDSTRPLWYIAASLAAATVAMVGAVTGRRLLFRHAE
jgi:hypothetical protein